MWKLFNGRMGVCVVWGFLKFPKSFAGYLEIVGVVCGKGIVFL